jgi:hypothetical protein
MSISTAAKEACLNSGMFLISARHAGPDPVFSSIKA